MLEIDPKPVWDYFEEISEIPRCSKNEEKLGKYVKSVAKEYGLEFQEDETGNIVVRKPATIDSDESITVLQAHMDMVCEKDEDVDHDFSTDPISLKRVGDWVTAEGTTLGADDGIGVAICLAILSSEGIQHGPLEFLFTVDEETGLTGASKLEPDFIEGRRLINVDSGDFGEFTIGSAGGGRSKISLPIKTKTKEDVPLLKISVSGLRGGHSGADINKGRANSIKVLSRLLWRIYQKMDGQILIQDISGGNKDNVIPRSSQATIMVDDSVGKAKKIILEKFREIKDEYKDIEKNMEIDIGLEQGKGRKDLFTSESSEKTLYLLQSLPHGVLAMSQELRNLVKTSTNLAKLSVKGDRLEIIMSTRSNVKSGLEKTRNRIQAIAETCGADVEEDDPYPGWRPNTDSELVDTLERTYKEIFDDEPKRKAVHAGLETGVIGQKFEGMDMVSVGPEIQNLHSTQEKVSIDSVRKLWKHLTRSLKELTNS